MLLHWFDDVDLATRRLRDILRLCGVVLLAKHHVLRHLVDVWVSVARFRRRRIECRQQFGIIGPTIARRSMQMSRGMQKHKELRRFVLYSLYAWGVPLLLTGTAILVDYNAWLPHEWRTNFIQDNLCWFKRELSASSWMLTGMCPLEL